MATSIGWASVQIVPVIRGVSGDISRQLQGPMTQAGTQAGQAAGRAAGEGMADGMQQSQVSISRASAKLAAARDKEADAAGKLRVAELKLQELRDKGNASASQLAAAEERVATAQRNADRATSGRISALNDLTQARARAANAAEEGEEQTRRFGLSMDTEGDKADGAAGKLAGLAVAVAGVGSAMELAGQALENMDITSSLGAQLGASPELAAEYGTMAGDLYKTGLVGSMQEASDAVLAVASTFEVAGFEGEKSIDQIASAATTFASTFGIEMTEAVQMADQLITNGLAKDSTEAFDLMAAAWGRTDLAMREELPALMNEYGQFFSSMGMDGEQAFGLLVNAADMGAISMDKVGDAVKELSIRATDLGDAGAQDALKELGLSGEETANALLAGGDAANEAFTQIVNGLTGMEDPAAQASAAVALFGTPLEDLGKDQIPGFLEGMATAGDSMVGFEGTMQEVSDSVNSGPNFAFQQLKNTITGGLTGALGDLATFLISNKDAIAMVAMVAAPFFLALAGYAATVRMITIATTAWNAIQMILNGTMMLNPIGLIVAAIAGLVAAVVLIATKTTWFQDIWAVAWNAIKAAWDWVWGALQSGFEMLKGAFSAVGDTVGAVKDWIVARWNDVVGFVTGLPGRIASAAAGMWDGIKNAFKGAINWIIQAWNALEFRIPGFEVGPIKWDGFTLGLPDIPMLAAGGPITGGTPGKDSVLAMLMPGEHVLDTGDVQALGGQQGVYRLRAALDAGIIPRFADGGAVVTPDQLVDFAKGVEGKPYVWGGVNWGDCSGAVSALANFATGLAPFASRFATMTEGAELAARGFKPGLGPAGSLQVGWYNGGPYGGHTAATLPNGVNFEMGGNRGNGQYGGQAAGARDPMFTDHAHLPMIVAQLIQPNVQQLAPLTGFPTDDGTTVTVPNGTDPGSTVSPSGTMGGAANGGTTTQAFSSRERIKQFGSEVGGIWADAAVEALGIGEWLDLVDRYTITPDSTGATATATPTATGAAPTPPASPLDPTNGVLGDLNMAPLIEQAQNFLRSVGLFDTGGVWEPGTFGFNGLKEPEFVLKGNQWDVAESAIDTVKELAAVGTGGGGNTYITNATFRDENEYYRRRAQEQRLDMRRHLGRWTR